MGSHLFEKVPHSVLLWIDRFIKECKIIFSVIVDGWEDSIIEPSELNFVVLDNALEEFFLVLGFSNLLINSVSEFCSLRSLDCSVPIESVLFGSLFEVAMLCSV